jgi:hypothetical protein
MSGGETMQSRRDAGITALVLGFFASAWFGWGQAAPPAGLGTWLTVGSVLALAVAAVGAAVGFRSPASTAALHDRAAGRRYGVIVGVEFGLAGLGAGVLAVLGQGDYIPVWVCAVVGVHLLPLAPLLRDRRLVVLGVLLTLVALVALVAGLTDTATPSTVTGVGAGLLLLGFAVAELAGALRQRR